MFILIVEDDKDTRDILTLLFSSIGHSVRTATSLHDALDIIRNRRGQSPSLMFLDYHLNGFPMDEFLAEVRLVRPGLPTILLSESSELFTQARDLGIKHYLVKPFSADELTLATDRAMAASLTPLIPFAKPASASLTPLIPIAKPA